MPIIDIVSVYIAYSESPTLWIIHGTKTIPEITLNNTVIYPMRADSLISPELSIILIVRIRPFYSFNYLHVMLLLKLAIISFDSHQDHMEMSTRTCLLSMSTLIVNL